MKEIQLTQGKVALVDDEDYEYLNQWKWYAHYDTGSKTYYVVRQTSRTLGKRKLLRMHRVIMNTDNDMVTDHINHNGLDNRKENLRNVTNSQNAMNRKVQERSEVTGVNYNKAKGGWVARIGIGGVSIELKFSRDKASAIEARKAAEKKYFGEFANKKDT